ncbi:MAG TPA: hypothetical protein VG273_25760 [Bryobacteraceae bacterium]|jgi:hypothetical protein|nr:hypothetical protein [Bryobacteraceae bacterium]
MRSDIVLQKYFRESSVRSRQKATQNQIVTIKACLIAATLGVTAFAGAPPQEDQITVDARIPVSSGVINAFVATRHFNETYVYAQRAGGGPATLIDVTRPGRPRVVSAEVAASTLVAVSGTAALASDAPPPPSPAPQTIRIMDFSDPAHPRVTRQFDGVTAVQRISASLIMLANPEGIWILTEHHAPDPEEEQRYARKVIYGESMF